MIKRANIKIVINKKIRAFFSSMLWLLQMSSTWTRRSKRRENPPFWSSIIFWLYLTILPSEPSCLSRIFLY